ncbi:MAG: hypothetical protein L3K03_03315 [Thermoplasmata archaeon]|nr:hypothetical protein [Thermoplasmata archaeon]
MSAGAPSEPPPVPPALPVGIPPSATVASSTPIATPVALPSLPESPAPPAELSAKDAPKHLADWTVCTIRFPPVVDGVLEVEGPHLTEVTQRTIEIGRAVGLPLSVPPELPPGWAAAQHGPFPGAVLILEQGVCLAEPVIRSRRKVAYVLEGILLVAVGFLFATIIAFGGPPLLLIVPLLLGGFGAGGLLARASARLFKSRVIRVQLWPIPTGGPIETSTRTRLVVEGAELTSVNHQTKSDPHRSVLSVAADPQVAQLMAGLVETFRSQLPLAPPPSPPVRRGEVKARSPTRARAPAKPRKPRTKRAPARISPDSADLAPKVGDVPVPPASAAVSSNAPPAPEFVTETPAGASGGS